MVRNKDWAGNERKKQSLSQHSRGEKQGTACAGQQPVAGLVPDYLWHSGDDHLLNETPTDCGIATESERITSLLKATSGGRMNYMLP